MSQQTICSFCAQLWQLHWAAIKHGLSVEFREFELTGHEGAIQRHMEMVHGMKVADKEIPA